MHRETGTRKDKQSLLSQGRVFLTWENPGRLHRGGDICLRPKMNFSTEEDGKMNSGPREVGTLTPSSLCPCSSQSHDPTSRSIHARLLRGPPGGRPGLRPSSHSLRNTAHGPSKVRPLSASVSLCLCLSAWPCSVRPCPTNFQLPKATRPSSSDSRGLVPLLKALPRCSLPEAALLPLPFPSPSSSTSTHEGAHPPPIGAPRGQIQDDLSIQNQKSNNMSVATH